MNHKTDQEHIDYIHQLNLDDQAIIEIETDEANFYPAYEMSRFMRYAWSEVINPDIEEGWLENTLAVLEGKNGDTQKQHISFYDESSPEYEDITSALKNMVSSGIDESDLHTVIRACQKNVLGSIFLNLDGGAGVANAQLFEIEVEDGEIIPKRYFTNMEDFFLDYDPKHLTENK